MLEHCQRCGDPMQAKRKNRKKWCSRHCATGSGRVGTHGMSKSPTYGSYMAAKDRCTNPRRPNYPRYGGLGIEFRFASFEQFLACVGPRPSGTTLDRINSDGHYEAGNVRWSTNAVQGRNRRNVLDYFRLVSEC
jgi:hypothetical protein